jgi:dihydroorotate dehydrogenase electron transfer subunit
MTKKRSKAKILSNRKIKDRYYKMALACRGLAQKVLPGQFFMIKVRESPGILLRRPLSAHRVSRGALEFFYEAVGKGTQMLSVRKPQESIDLLGPLGNGFDCRLATSVDRKLILVAGGMGVAPLVFLAEKLTQLKAKSRKKQVGGRTGKILVLLGARTKEQLLCEKEFKKIGCDVKIATDDGSAGFQGRVTELLEESLSTSSYRLSAIYACGPQPMLKEVCRISSEKGIPAQVSLEAHMACGIGACLGCVVSTKDGYLRVCKEGPVFDAQRLTY